MQNITILYIDINQRLICRLPKIVAITALFALSTACATRAPSSREMDKSSVFTPALNEGERAEKPGPMRMVSSVGKKPAQPLRTAPWVEKVWVYDHELSSNTYFQGTYVFLEVQPAHWNDTQRVKP